MQGFSLVCVGHRHLQLGPMRDLHPIVSGQDQETTVDTEVSIMAYASVEQGSGMTLSTMEDTRVPGPPYGDSDWSEY